jgi:hypothetical protein
MNIYSVEVVEASSVTLTSQWDKQGLQIRTALN